MNHETRLKTLEKEVQQLKALLLERTSSRQWLSLSEIKEQYAISPTVLRRQIKEEILVHKKDWIRNGKKYLVNVDALKKVC
jgi:hypothetical protein